MQDNSLVPPAPARRIPLDVVVQSGLMIALLAVSAQIVIPFGPIPFTLQTLVVVLISLIFTPGQAALTMILYIVLGALGLPFFSGLGAGLAKLAGPTGGYLYGFIASVIVGSLLRRALCKPRDRLAAPKRALAADICAAVVAIAICYAVGTMHFMTIGMLSENPYGLAYVLGVCVVPFIIPDIAKCAAAILVAQALHKAIPAVVSR